MASLPTTESPPYGTNEPFPEVEPKTPASYHHDPSPNNTTHVPPHSIPRRKPVPAQSHPQKHSYFDEVKQKYSRMSKRTKIIIGVTIACLLILIIGLAAGLSTRNKVQNLPLPSNNGGPYQGELTYYAPALGACGIDSKNGDNIVAVSHLLFDAVSKSSNPNQNPLCGKMIRAKRSTGSVDLKVVDRCTGCQPRDLDITEKTFAELANVDQGRVNVEWSWLEGVPGAAS
jgi:hypothetical protein